MVRCSAATLTSARAVRRAVVGAALGITVSALAGCADLRDDAAASEGRYGGTLVVAGPNDLGNLSPFGTPDRFTQEFSRFVVYLPLVRFTPELDFEPALAREWELEGDTAVTFRLRDDVRWHDGRPTTAHDVLFTYERIKDPATAFGNAGLFEHWVAAEVLDSFTIRFRITPHPDPLYGWTEVPPLPRHLLDTVPSERMQTAAFNRAPVGNGPFRFVSYAANDRWVFEANPDFPEDLGGRPYLDRLVWRVIPENSAQLTELLAGNADLITSPRAEEVKEMEQRPEIRALLPPSRQYLMVAWNGKLPMFADARVRRAMTVAIDRRDILVALRGGWGELASGPVPPYHWGYPRDVEPLPFDPAVARGLLAQAGWTNRDDDPWLENTNGEEFTFSLSIPAGNAFNRDVAELIRGDLEGIGVRMRTEATEWGTLVGRIIDPERRFEAVLLGFESDFRLSLRDQLHSDAYTGPYQLSSYRNPEVDRLIDSTAVMADRETAKPLLKRLQSIIREEQPMSFLYYYPDLRLIRERVKGADMDIRGNFATLTTWWLDPGAATAAPAAQATE